jgi:hypothetical protein
MRRCSASSTTPTPLGLRCSCTQPAICGCQPLLELQVAREQLIDPRQLRQPGDPLPGQVADVGGAVEAPHVVQAQRVKRDRADEHELVVAVVVGKRRRPERLRGQELRVCVDHAARGLEQLLVLEVRPERGKERSGDAFGGRAVNDSSRISGGAEEFEVRSVVDRGHGLLASRRPAVLPAEPNAVRNAVSRTPIGMSKRSPIGFEHSDTLHPGRLLRRAGGPRGGAERPPIRMRMHRHTAVARAPNDPVAGG